jgi:Fur family ferric uptake transcriptional regulator
VTVAPRRRPLAFNDLDGAARAIRNAGYRLSAARRVVLQALFAAEGPVSAEYVADGLGGRLTRSDLTSVYRNLETLEELGVVNHVHMGHGPGLYALAGEGEREYLVCERCNRVRGVDPAELDPVRERIRETFGYEARFSHFPILALCPSCAAAEAGKGEGRATESGGGTRRSSGARDKAGSDEYSHEHSHGDRVHAHPHGDGKGNQEHTHEH